MLLPLVMICRTRAGVRRSLITEHYCLLNHLLSPPPRGTNLSHSCIIQICKFIRVLTSSLSVLWLISSVNTNLLLRGKTQSVSPPALSRCITRPGSNRMQEWMIHVGEKLPLSFFSAPIHRLVMDDGSKLTTSFFSWKCLENNCLLSN